MTTRVPSRADAPSGSRAASSDGPGSASTSSAAAFSTVEAQHVSKVYGRERALAPLDLRLGPGDSVALLGPNGAGKSTLVGILATLVTPSTGTVRFDGAAPSARHRGGIGVLAHDALVYGDLTARENLRFFATLYSAPGGAARPAEQAERVEWMLGRVGLDHAADRPARTFSRGMSQRLAIARALLHQPRLLLLDEPFTGLDRDGSAMLRELLVEARAGGAMVLLVTHDLEPLAGLCDRVLLLRRGRVAFVGAAPGDHGGFVELYRAHVDGSGVGVGDGGGRGEADAHAHAHAHGHDGDGGGESEGGGDGGEG